MSSPQQRKRRLLIADESITIQKLVHLSLAGSVFEVITASDGLDALQKLKTLKPDLILADSELRQLDGLDLIEKIRADSSLTSIKTVLMKGAKLSSIKESRLKSLPADEILTKPFDSKTLVDLVHLLVLDEDSTVVPTKFDRINQRLQAAAADLRSSSDAEPTTPATPLPSISAAPSVASAPPSEDLAKEEIRKWIQDSLPAIAERLLKDEISKLFR